MLTPEQRDVLIRTVWGEAADQGPQGWAAVASVINNRANDPSGQWSRDPRQVALQPKQFSTWNSGEGGNALPYSLDPNSPDYQKVGQIVDQVFAGSLSDPTGGDTNYYAPRGMKNGQAPKWWGMINPASVTKIGDHVFGSASGQPHRQPVLGGMTQPSQMMTGLARAFQSDPVVSTFTPRNLPSNVSSASTDTLNNGDQYRTYTTKTGKTITSLERGGQSYAVLSR